MGGHSHCDLFQIGILNHHNNSRRYVLALFSFYKETETKEVKKQTKSDQFGSTYNQIEAMQRLAGALDKGNVQIHKAVHVFKTNAAWYPLYVESLKEIKLMEADIRKGLPGAGG